MKSLTHKRDQAIYDVLASEGPLTDAAMMRQHGVLPSAAVRRLVEGGHIRSFVDAGALWWGICTRPEAYDWDDAGLGERTDTEIAEELGCTASAVCRARQRRGVAAFRGVGRPQRGS